VSSRPARAGLRARVAASPLMVTGLVLAILFVFFAVAAPNFLTFYALSNVLTFASVFGIVTVGIALLMISGEFDLSVRSTIAISGYVFIYALLRGVPPVLAMGLALVACAALGLINGLIVIWTGLPSFITTMGTMLAYFGIVRAMGGGKPLSYTPHVKPVLFDVLNGYLAPINNLTDPAGNLRVASVWFILVVIAMTYVLMRTRWGNWTFAVGGNPAAALAQGVNVRLVKLVNFTLSGALAGLAGAILFAQRSSMNERMANGVELTVVAAAVVGGVSLRGGVGSVVGAAMGMILLTMLEQGLALMGVPVDAFQGVLGALIIVSSLLNKYISERG
jgi:simple sugar transport system permease protein